MPAEIVIRALRKSDDRSSFTCGERVLDRYFREFAGQQLTRGSAGIQVAVIDDEIVGFATTIATEIRTEGFPAKSATGLPRQVPVLRLARLAVAIAWQGHGVGDHLMRKTLEQALELKDVHGCLAVVVDAKPAAVGYYRRA